MIGTLDIKVNAAHPNLPLPPYYVFVSAPSSPRVINVPKRIGTWEITKVFVSANFPDNTTKSVEMRNVAGCWVGTLPACDVVGDSANGFQITANGIDEAGNTVTGYCLGKGDLFVMSRAGNITVNGTTWYFNFKDTVPEHPIKGDAAIIDGTLKWFNGTAWIQFGGLDLSDISVNLGASQDSINAAFAEVIRKCGGTVID